MGSTASDTQDGPVFQGSCLKAPCLKGQRGEALGQGLEGEADFAGVRDD